MLKTLSGIIEQARRGLSIRPVRQGSSARQPLLTRLLAKYDAANTTLDNIKHWSRADGLSASAANSPDVRRILRNRSRYEVANNSYARGIRDRLSFQCLETTPSRIKLVFVIVSCVIVLDDASIGFSIDGHTQLW